MKNKKASVALSSVFASLFLTVIKLAVGLLTLSMGILSEAAHSALDFGAALLTYFAVKIGDRPADANHPYGHGKVESVSALIETGLLFLTSFYIIYESVHRLFFKAVEVRIAWYSFLVIGISVVVDFSRSRALAKTAKETGSHALEADALHFSSDIWSSLVVLAGLVFVHFGINGADAIAALGVAIFVMAAGFKLGKRTIDVLVDTAPAGITEKVTEIISSLDEIISVERIRVRPLGPSVSIDIALAVSRKLSLEKVQSIVKKIKAKIAEEIHKADIIIHASPAKETSETLTDALQVLAARYDLFIHDIIIDRLNNRNYLSYHVEVPGNLSVMEAHELAKKIEDAFRNEIDPEAEINAHLEPIISELVFSRPLEEKEKIKMEKIIFEITKEEKAILDVHDIFFTQNKSGLSVALHCHVKKDEPIHIIHEMTSRVEFLIKGKLPGIFRVIVHAEPKQ